MTLFVLPLHIVAVIVWLGGVITWTIAMRPSAAEMAHHARSLHRSFSWGTISLALVVVTGAALTQFRFGGMSGMPTLHRWNVPIGVTAIALFSAARVFTWPALRRALRASHAEAIHAHARRLRALLAGTALLATIATVLSAMSRA